MINLRSNAPRLLTLGLVALMATPGCSWLFVEPLNPAAASGGYGTCTTNVVAPVLDTLFVGTNVASVLYVAGQDNNTNKSQSIALGLSVASLWLASAVYGYSHTSECTSYVERNYQEPPRRARPPRPYSPPNAMPPAAPPPSGWDAPPAVYRQAPAAAPASPAQSAPAAGTPAPASQPAPAPPPAPQAPQQQDNDDPR